MNQVNLIGRLTKDVDLRYTEQGTAVAKFTLAVNGTKPEDTSFISCVAFGKTAETVTQYCNKGSQLGLTGSIKTGSYDKEDGTKVYTTDVIVNRIYFVGSKQNSMNDIPPEFGGSFTVQADNSFGSSDDDELPF